MNQYDLELRELRSKLARKAKLKNMLQDLKQQKDDLVTEEQKLLDILHKEQTDVDKLEKVSLNSVFYTLIGKKDEQLDKEQMEAYAAAVKHDSVLSRLESVKSEIYSLSVELDTLGDCETQYEKMFKKKSDYLIEHDAINGEKILNLEKQRDEITSQMKEIDEALVVGQNAEVQVQKIKSSLDSAESWGTLDLFGGGFISTMAKHSNLDAAQSEVKQLQDILGRYKAELSDVEVNVELGLNVKVDGFLRFADYFFDGLFADWAVLDKISKSQSEVHTVESQINEIQNQLKLLSSDLHNRKSQIISKLNTLVNDAET